MCSGAHIALPSRGKGRAVVGAVVLGERLASWVELTPPVGPISYRGKSSKKLLLSAWPLPCRATSTLSVVVLGWAEQDCRSLVDSELPVFSRITRQATPPPQKSSLASLCHPTGGCCTIGNPLLSHLRTSFSPCSPRLRPFIASMFVPLS